MTRRARLFWKLLFGFLVVCALSSLVAWGVLLTSFCSNPRKPSPDGQYIVAYSCHGMTVFISPAQEAMREWLIPLGMLFVLLSLVAGAMVLLARAKVHVDVQIEHAGFPGRSPPAGD